MRDKKIRYKAYNPGMICNGRKYHEGEEVKESGNKICNEGVIHYCENPFDVLDYYPLVNQDGNMSEFSTVEPLAEELHEGNKSACNHVKIGAKLGFKGFITACVEFVIEKTKPSKISKKETSGDGAQIGSSGDWAQIGSSGDGAQIGSSGDWAQIKSEGKNSIICCAGHGSIVSAQKGSWITLAEWVVENGEVIPVCVKTRKVDGKHIKPNTPYRLVNGKFEEVKND